MFVYVCVFVSFASFFPCVDDVRNKDIIRYTDFNCKVKTEGEKEHV